MNLRNAFVGLFVVLTATVVPATPAVADPIPDVQSAISAVIDLPVETPVISDDFGWG
ncbi:hypothetical protein [Streptomyces sp900116325]|uniref:hypothetical protein n=1 Tax=Streptomyces sp. 900116325 TaxID=3154295 RepID=UPI003322154C